ncbi:MAG: hypothetical protein KF763_13890 [Cyclobacteriaceae bacterium]|nr:hypothetical protein [Cyclobacteriaceae bacterium]
MEQEFPFSKNLFWDVAPESIDLTKHKRFVIERVLVRGNLIDFEKLIQIYSKDEIREAIRMSKELDPKTQHFCSWYFEIPAEELYASLFYR